MDREADVTVTSVPAVEDTREPAGPAPRPRRWALVLLRTGAVLFLLDTLFQAALAGLFVTGDVDLLTWHKHNADLLSALVAVQAVAAGVLWRKLRAPVWPFVLTLGLIVLLIAQQSLGESRMLGGHIPLGMAIFGAAAALTYWAFAYRPAPPVLPVLPAQADGGQQ
ncbi:hypothetical protein [Streptomyces sp. NPDC054787]